MTKKVLLASALLVPLAMVGLTFVQPLLHNTPPQCELWPRMTVDCIAVSGPGGDVPGPMIGGTVTSSPAGIDCPPTCSSTYKLHTWVTLTATPSRGWVFMGWNSGSLNNANCYMSTRPCTMWMDKDTFFWSADFRRR